MPWRDCRTTDVQRVLLLRCEAAQNVAPSQSAMTSRPKRIALQAGFSSRPMSRPRRDEGGDDRAIPGQRNLPVRSTALMPDGIDVLPLRTDAEKID